MANCGFKGPLFAGQSGETAQGGALILVRSIVKTPVALIDGVFPLVIATGAGAEMRQSLETAVTLERLPPVRLPILWGLAYAKCLERWHLCPVDLTGWPWARPS